MTELFGRYTEMLVGKRGEKGRLITGLRMTFKIDRALEKSPNTGAFSIYNASEETRGIIAQSGAVCRFRAGYGDTTSVPTLFVGDLIRTTTKKNGPDVVTDFSALDGGEAFESKDVNLSYAKGATSGQVLTDILSVMGLSTGEIKGFDLIKQLSGFAFAGKAKDALDTILGKQGLTWSIQDERIQILPKDVSTGSKAVLLSPKTGLVGSPFTTKVINGDLIKKSAGGADLAGVSLTSLLNPLIKPGAPIKVESKFVNGVFRCEKVTHQGDTHGTNYYSVCNAKEIG